VSQVEPNNDLYTVNLETLECTKVEKKGYWPPPIICHTAILNPETKKMYIYGGLAKYKTSSNLYELDLATLEWKRIETQESSPPPRSSHTAVFYQGAMIVYGGKNADGDMLGDLWELNLTDFTWKQHELTGEVPKVICLLSVATIWTFNGYSWR
jgi:hypothetical protein